MYNIKNPDRLDFIRKISKERGIDEIFSIEDAKKNDIVKIGKHSRIGVHSILLGHCEIGDYVDIWSNVVIKEGVKIGEHSMIGACSYVDADLPPNSHFVSEYKKIIHNFSKN